MNISYKIKNHIIKKLFFKKKNYFIESFKPFNKRTHISALLYYKYDKNFRNAEVGSTLYQSLKIAESLNKNGYEVTVVDRNCNFLVKKNYDLFIGAFNTGGFKYFEKIVNQLDSRTKIVGLSTGANPAIMKKNFEERDYKELSENGANCDLPYPPIAHRAVFLNSLFFE